MKNNYIKMIGNCISFIENTLKDKVSVEDVLKETYYSYPHFSRIFMDIVGESVTGYIRKRKLSCAANDLILNKNSIVEIALNYGFSSQQTFNRAFTNMFQMSPQKYREKGMLDDVYKPFVSHITDIVPVSSTAILIEELPAMKLASFHSYNDKISTKNQLIQWDKVVSKAWGALIKWQMSYEYQKLYGRIDKLPNTNKLGSFFIENDLHLPPNTRYFGFTNPYPFSDTEYGYEAWAILNNDSEIKEFFLDNSDVKIKEFSGGLYAMAEATYGKNSNLDETWKMLHCWIAENDQYDYGEHQWLEEHITKAGEGGFHSCKLYMAIKRVDIFTNCKDKSGII